MTATKDQDTINDRCINVTVRHHKGKYTIQYEPSVEIPTRYHRVRVDHRGANFVPAGMPAARDVTKDREEHGFERLDHSLRFAGELYDCDELIKNVKIADNVASITLIRGCSLKNLEIIKEKTLAIVLWNAEKLCKKWSNCEVVEAKGVDYIADLRPTYATT